MPDPRIDVEPLLRNWGAWLRQGESIRGHCFSIEGRYRSPQCWYPPEPREPEANPHEAFKVERVMPQVPRKHRQALKFHYAYRMPDKLCCVRLAIRLSTWDGFIGDARAMVGNLLTLKEVRRNLRKNSVSSVITDESMPLGRGVDGRNGIS